MLLLFVLLAVRENQFLNLLFPFYLHNVHLCPVTIDSIAKPILEFFQLKNEVLALLQNIEEERCLLNCGLQSFFHCILLHEFVEACASDEN